MKNLNTYNKAHFWFSMLCGSFILFSNYFLYSSQSNFLFVSVLPLCLFVIFLALFSIEKLTLLTVFCTPLAVTLKEMGFASDLDLSIPTEPLMAGILLLVLFHQIHKGIIHHKIFTHIITICILIQLAWTLISCLFSEMPLISVKFLTARLWFICTGFFICSHIFSHTKNIYRFLWLYILPLTLVIIYTLIGHANQGFDEKSADWIMSPFYNDHTAYAAVIAMFIPVLMSLLFKNNYSLPAKLFTSLVLLLFLAAIILSYTRAAWISLAGSAVILFFLLLRIKFKYLLFSVVTAVILLLLFQSQIILLLQQNHSHSDGDLGQNLQSISNINTDPSNVERLNRWDCAIKMFKERPVTGWGPGTYMFQYAPFQSHELKTVISTNAGTNGNSHSEYLGPLSEQGLPGLICFIAVLLSVYFTAFRLCFTLQDPTMKTLIFGVLLGLTTYFIHGLLNNFLDTDKAAIPFWGFIAIILSVDLFHSKKKQPQLNS